MNVEEFLDPIARANRRRERDHYLDNLFHPIYDLPTPEPRWLVQGWIPEGYLVFLASPPKSGKTCLATQLALNVATGTPFAGMPTQQAAVLWLAQEESPAERRLVLADHPLAQPSTPLYTCYEPLPIDQEDSLDAINNWVMQTDAKLVVIDPLHGATSGRSLQDGWNARRTLKGLKRLCTQTGVTALVLHHSKQPTKANPHPRVAESDQLAATASMQIILTSKPLTSEKPPRPSEGEGVGGEGSGTPLPGERSVSSGEPGEGPPERAVLVPQTPAPSPETPAPRLITLRCSGRGDFANRTLHIVSLNLTDYQLTEPVPDAEPMTKTSYLETQVLALLEEPPHTTDEICEALNTNPGTLRNAITRLRATGQITIIDRTRAGNVYGKSPKKLVKTVKTVNTRSNSPR